VPAPEFAEAMFERDIARPLRNAPRATSMALDVAISREVWRAERPVSI